MDPRLAPTLWAPYVDDIHLGCLAHEPVEDTALVVAIGLRETWLGTCPGYSPRGPNGRGDGGHGRGLFQIDDRHEFAALIPPDGQDWSVLSQAWCCAHVLARAREELSAYARNHLFERAVVCRYNSSGVARAMAARLDPDSVTTRGSSGRRDYGSDVLGLRDGLRRLYPSTFPPFARAP
jgi:hypothetical protein